jgi:hypothetical protein
MAFRPFQQQLDPGQVQALLSGWYDIVGPQVGQWGHGPYRGSQFANRGLPFQQAYILGADPQTGAPVATPVPPGTPGSVTLPPPPQMQMPMGPPPVMMAPPDAFPFPARAAVVSAPMPTQANRDILPMSTGVPILPTQSAQITGRPQTLVFKIGRFVISNAGTAGGSADWIVNDIKIGNRSQFVQSGDVPGDLFATNAIDTFVRFESAQTAMDVVVVVTYIGLNESGAPFFGAMVGTAAV